MRRLQLLAILGFCTTVGIGVLYFRRELAGGSKAVDHLHAARPTDRISQNTNASFAAIPAFSWRDVESEDYRQYVQNLRRLGCPEAAVDDIAIADVNALFLNRAKPILDDLRQAFIRYYHGPPNPAGKGQLLATARTKLQPLNNERFGLFSKILGREPEKFKTASEPWGYEVDEILANEFPYLSAEKSAKVSELKKSATQKIDSRIPHGSPVRQEQLRFLDEVQRSLNSEVASVLTPAEFEDYMVHNSLEADELSRKLGTNVVTDTEFRQMLRAVVERYKDGYYATIGSGDAVDGTERDLRLKVQLEAVLGPKRYEGYERDDDVAYKMIKVFSQQNPLTEEQMTQLYGLRKRVEQEVAMVVATSLDQEAQRRRVLELMDAAQASASQVLGDSNLVSRFTQTPAGYWLERLRSRPDAVRMHGVGITRE